MTGWFNFLGQVAVTCGISFGLAGLISVTASIDGTYVPTAGSFSVSLLLLKLSNTSSVKFVDSQAHTRASLLSSGKTIAIYLGLIVSHGLINTFGVKYLPYLNNVSIALHSLGIFSFAVAIVAKAPTHQSAKFVFTTFFDGTGVAVGDLDPVGWAQRASPAYVAIVGILMAQYTITGKDKGGNEGERKKTRPSDPSLFYCRFRRLGSHV